MSEYRQSYSTTIAAPVTDCFAVLVAFEDYPRWSSPITSCRVLEHHADGLPKRVEFMLDMTVKTIRYVLDYTYDPPHGATWTLVEGDVTDIEGAYRFEESDGRHDGDVHAGDRSRLLAAGLRAQRPREEGAARFRRGVPARGRGATARRGLIPRPRISEPAPPCCRPTGSST